MILTEKHREELRVQLLNCISKFLKSKNKTAPDLVEIEQTLSVEIRRLLVRLHRKLLHRTSPRSFFVVYYGIQRRDVKIVRLETDSLGDLRDLITKYKPSWAVRCKSYPLADELLDDINFPLSCYWPQIERDTYNEKI